MKRFFLGFFLICVFFFFFCRNAWESGVIKYKRGDSNNKLIISWELRDSLRSLWSAHWTSAAKINSFTFLRKKLFANCSFTTIHESITFYWPWFSNTLFAFKSIFHWFPIIQGASTTIIADFVFTVINCPTSLSVKILIDFHVICKWMETEGFLWITLKCFANWYLYKKYTCFVIKRSQCPTMWYILPLSQKKCRSCNSDIALSHIVILMHCIEYNPIGAYIP